MEWRSCKLVLNARLRLLRFGLERGGHRDWHVEAPIERRGKEDEM